MIFKQHNLIKKTLLIFIVFSGIYSTELLKEEAQAFPIYAQQAYENPREATGRIVCANCHLAQKNIELDVPKAILPNTIFEATVTIPYDTTNKQILGNGKKGNMNVGAVLILPDGFKIAPNDLIPEEIKEKTKNTYIQPYSTQKTNILVVGPMPSNKSQTITFPIISPDPLKDKNVHFLKYPIYAGGNRGRGQVYPSGEKTNNNPIVSTVNGKIIAINNLDNGNYIIDIETIEGKIISENIPKELDLTVSMGDNISTNQPLTRDPNVGGFGQNETEVVLQSSNRITGMIIFFTIISVAQTLFVIKKKQWEKVQASEMSF